MKNKPAIGIGITAAIAALGLVALASDSARTEKPAAVDAQEYADFMANEALDVQDLAEGAELQRRTFNRMTPPGLSWVQPMFPLTVPFDAANFNEKFLDELLGEDRNSVAVYPLTLALDPKTRETWIYNAEGKPIAALPPEKISRAWPEGSDPARVVLRLDLLPAEDVEPYLYVEDRMAETVSAFSEKAAKSARKEAVAKSGLSGGQFGFADARKLTNGNFRLTVTNGPAAAEIFSYTIWHTSSVVVSTWTNDLDEVVVSTNVVWTPVSPPYAGLESAWEVETTNLLLTNGVGIWEDASATGSARVRFYGTTQRADSDEDGLTDGAEIFLHRTDPSLSDTDGDGMPDGWEVTYGLNARSGLDESLVGWWKLDDGAGSNAVNSAQDAYHGELVGFSGLGGGWTGDGCLGGALRFDGIDDWVRIAQDPAMLTGGPFTVSAQVWLDPDCASAWPEAVADYEASTYNGYCLGFNENRAYAMVGPYGWLMDSNALAGRWVWTALEYDGAQMRLYLDGVLAGATPVAFVPATNGFFAIGNGQDDSFGSEFWKGRIDDVRLYRAVLGTNGLAGMYDAQADPDGDGWLNLQESAHGTDPFRADTDEDGISDGDDPEPLVANQEPIMRFRHPLDGQTFLGPAKIELSSEWIYGTQPPSQAVYRIESLLDGATNEIAVAAGSDQKTNWYAPPGVFRLTVRGVDAGGRTGETRRVDVAVAESGSFAALTAAEKQTVLENGPRAVEGVEEWTYGYSGARTGSLPVAAAGSRILAGFAQATNFTAVPVSNSYLDVDYHDRDATYATVVPGNTPTTNLFATLYGAARWGARLEANLPPPSSPRGWPVAYDSFLVFDQNERGEWVGKVYPSLNNLATNDPHALLHMGYGAERDAFFYRNGSYQVLLGPTNFNGEFDYRLVFGLNNAGLVVGAGLDYEAHGGGMYLGLEEFRPIVYGIGQTGTVLAVSTQAIGGAAYAVNDKGVIVGCEIASNEMPRAVRWVNGQVAAVGGLTGATQSVAFDVGEDGTIAGMQKIGGQWRPFLADAASGDAFSPAMLGGVDFREFWHVGKFGALGWGASNDAQRLYWVFPDDDQDGFSDVVEQEIVAADPFDTLITIAGVLGSDDFDGDGLTNAQEWEKQSDPVLKDSDGDRLPDGTDPWPLTRRDRDGDGLPDDWETHHGLNPLSATGANGAAGDPDGDGLVNRLEFELDTVPTGPNGPAFRFHRDKLNQLQVSIEDSLNCPNGTQDSRQIVERSIRFVEILDTNLPPLDINFLVGVAGRVERQDAGYDLVSVNGVRAFAGSSEGLGCEMAEKSEWVVVPVSVPPGDLVLTYDTYDGAFHTGAFARVTGIALTQAETNVPSVEVAETEIFVCAGCTNGCTATFHLTNGNPVGVSADWYGGPSNALLGTGTSVTIDYTAWPPASYRIVACATGNVAYADAAVLHVLKVETAFADPDDANWADLAEEKVILSDKDTRIKIKVTPQLADLQTIFYAIGTTVNIKTSGTAPNGQDFTMTSQNTTLVQESGYSELRVALTRSQLISLGVLPSQESDSVTEKAWYDTGFDTDVSWPNLLDGHAFDNGMSAETRGQCTQAIYGGLDSTPPNSPLDNSFFKAGGVEIITAECCSGVSDKRQLMNQADYFYYSGHGWILTGAVYPGGPSDVSGYWDKDLNVIIFAGCSVLDINDYNDNTNGAAHLASPGKLWEPIGPEYFLGYNWKAPTDLQNSDSIISSWLSNRGALGNIEAWRAANDNSNGHNACAIIKNTSYFYFRRILGIPVWTEVQKADW
jgi:hypothetical protein